MQVLNFHSDAFPVISADALVDEPFDFGPMSDSERPIDWGKTTFDGNRREQLRQAQAMTVRERLEALDQLTALSERLQVMPKKPGG